MLWIKALHIIAMVAWFAGLFYLPRLFVYHCEAKDDLSIERFKIMEWRLYYFIATPAAILTALLGFWLLILEWPWYKNSGWLHLKLTLVMLLFLFHIYCGVLLHRFRNNTARHSSKFYRILNEVPTVFLILIVLLAVVKPF